MNRLLQMLGIVLLLGGLGHSLGIVHLYVTSGIPDTNRVLLVVWIAEAQLLGGGLYLAAFRASRRGSRMQLTSSRSCPRRNVSSRC